MLRNGQAWVWLNAAAVGLCLCTLTGLLLLIAVRGLGHFWPADLSLYVYQDGTGAKRRVLGELVEVEAVPRRQHLESGVGRAPSGAGPLRRLVIKTGNRRLDPRISRTSTNTALNRLPRRPRPRSWSVWSGATRTARSWR